MKFKRPLGQFRKNHAHKKFIRKGSFFCSSETAWSTLLLWTRSVNVKYRTIHHLSFI